ncbi:anaerobic ribonucleoside-triphosphate reductase [Vibrio phage 1.170.O._10N.261.52.C3]|nr:anaerobic ribonucleoside-triphosphate reductase [Vibrio phage 1.170.O._10N.261.52.C3]
MLEGIKKIVSCEDENVLKENANKDGQVFSTQRDLVAGEVAKHYAETEGFSPHLIKSHKEGFLHIHDLDYFPLMGYTNCCLVNLKGMLDEGFKINDVEITKPKSISTAMTLASQIVMAVGSSQYGGISLDRFDEVMGEYVIKSYNKHYQIAELYQLVDAERYAKERTEKEVYDACQTFEYQVNSMTCTSGQSPFITVSFGLGTKWEERLVQEMILKIRIEGLGEHKVTAIFPKLLYTLKDGVNLNSGDANYDIKKLALECSSKRLYPDILNYEKVVEVTGSFKGSMGCRSFLSKYEEDGEEIHSGRANLGVCTINLPMLAVEAKGDKGEFYRYLEQYLLQSRQVCEERLGHLAKVKAKSAPILYTEGALLRLDPEDYVLPHLIKKDCSISIGYIGLNEVAEVMFPEEKHILDSKTKQDFTIDLMKYLNSRVKEFKEDSGVGYSVYGTPSESQCKRLRDCIFTRHGDVKGVTDKEYLTNSFHLEASKQTDPYTRMDFESQYIPYSAGGFISYSELPDMRGNLEALEDLWDFSYRVTPYYAINTPADQCFECKYEGEMENKSKGFVCPSCGNSDQSKMFVIRRVSGYLGNPNTRPFNEGKNKETTDRVKNL